MRTIYTLAFCFFTLSTFTFAQDQTLTIVQDFKSRNVVDNAGIPHDGPVSQTDITWCWIKTLCGEGFLSTGFKTLPGVNQEVDLGGILKTGIGKFSAKYNFLINHKPADVAQFAWYIPLHELKRESHTLSPFVQLDGLLMTKSTLKNSGYFLRGGAAYSFSLKDVLLGVQEDLFRDSGIFAGQKGFVWNSIPSITLLRLGNGYELEADVRFALPFGGKVGEGLRTIPRVRLKKSWDF